MLGGLSDEERRLVVARMAAPVVQEGRHVVLRRRPGRQLPHRAEGPRCGARPLPTATWPRWRCSVPATASASRRCSRPSRDAPRAWWRWRRWRPACCTGATSTRFDNDTQRSSGSSSTSWRPRCAGSAARCSMLSTCRPTGVSCAAWPISPGCTTTTLGRSSSLCARKILRRWRAPHAPRRIECSSSSRTTASCRSAAGARWCWMRSTRQASRLSYSFQGPQPPAFRYIA